MKQRKILLHVSYNGRGFFGFYAAYGMRTVQRELEKVLTHILEEPITVETLKDIPMGCSAQMLPVLFFTTSQMEPKELVLEINRHIGVSIRVCDATELPEDTAPYLHHKSIKKYEYRFFNSIHPMLSEESCSHQEYQKLDVDSMQLAADVMIGENDFSAFTTKAYKDPFCTIYEIEVERRREQIVVSVSANRFLANMLQMITGELIRVGRGEIEPGELEKRLYLRTPDPMAPELPIQGLIFTEVHQYDSKDDVIHNNNAYVDYYVVNGLLQKEKAVYIILLRCEDDVFSAIVNHAANMAYLDDPLNVFCVDATGDRLREHDSIGKYKVIAVKDAQKLKKLSEFNVRGTWYLLER